MIKSSQYMYAVNHNKDRFCNVQNNYVDYWHYFQKLNNYTLVEQKTSPICVINWKGSEQGVQSIYLV